MKKDLVTRSPRGLVFNLEPDELIRVKVTQDSAPKPKYKTYKVLEKYPFIVLCQDFNGHKECFSSGDFYSGRIVRVEE